MRRSRRRSRSSARRSGRGCSPRQRTRRPLRGRGEGDAERPRREARDVDVRAGVGAGLVGERRPEASPLVVGERAVGRRADVLDVVGNPVRVVVVQRRRVDAEHDVVHHDPLRGEGALRRRVVVVDLEAVRGDGALRARDVGRARPRHRRSGRRHRQEQSSSECRRRDRLPRVHRNAGSRGAVTALQQRGNSGRHAAARSSDRPIDGAVGSHSATVARRRFTAVPAVCQPVRGLLRRRRSGTEPDDTDQMEER